MGVRKVAIITVLFFLFLSGSMPGVVFASSGNWVEVVRFEGSEEIQTEPFTCNYVEWRIKWNSSPAYEHRGGPRVGIFMIQVYEHSTEKYVSSVGSEPTNKSESGILSLNENGTFHLNIGGLFRGEYLVIVEQNLDSIPEFPSWTLLPLFLIFTLGGILIKKRLFRLN